MHLSVLSDKSLPEQIKTIFEFNEKIYKEKASEFIAQIFHIDAHEQSEEILDKVRKKFYDATHHCFAYKLLSGEKKYSDDGEPKGTAGLRILNAIEHFELTNVMIVVIRYFGGTKLGVGPLGKAYYQSAFNVIDEKKIVQMNLFRKISVQTGFNYISQIHRCINSFSGIIDSTEFTTNAKFSLLLKPSEIEKFKSEIINATNGNVQIEIIQSFEYHK